MTRIRLRPDRDLAAWGVLAAAHLAVLMPSWLAGLTPFWGDLTYIHHPWRAFDAQVVQAGRLPLWDPYLYFGMPAAATMQDSLFYPGSAPFFLMGFANALFLFHVVNYGLSAALAFLWLRSLSLRRAAALAGAGLLSLGGVWLENRPFLNHLGVLSLLPGVFLFARRPRPLAAVLCASFFAGYPPFFLGGAAAACAFSLAFSSGGLRATVARGWLAAGVWAAALSGCLLLPAAELVGLSHRASGVGLDEALQFGFAPADLVQWASPFLLHRFDPAIEWWKSCFVGLTGLALAFWGLRSLPRRRAAALAVWLMAVLILILGGSNPISAALWARFWPLRFIRYPGNCSYLAVPALALCAAAGLHVLGRARRLALAALLLVELASYGAGAFPLAPASLFISAGPLARLLQDRLEGHRYLLSPRALEAGQGAGYEDWKQRLYGLTNAPYHLRAAGNFGEPLVPQGSYEAMDRLYAARGAQKAAEFFPWTDIRFLLTPGAVPDTARLAFEGAALWRLYRSKGPAAGAYAFSESEGERLPAGSVDASVLPAPGRPLILKRTREDRFSIAGESTEPGWVYVSEPRYPGWSVRLLTEHGEGRAPAQPALGAFQKVHVPAGPWRLDFRYEPDSFAWGLSLTVLSALALAWSGLRRPRSVSA